MNKLQKLNTREILEMAVFYHSAAMGHSDWTELYKDLGETQTEVFNLCSILIDLFENLSYLRKITETDIMFLLSKIESHGIEENEIKKRIEQNAKRFPKMIEYNGDLKFLPCEYLSRVVRMDETEQKAYEEYIAEARGLMHEQERAELPF